MAERKLMYLDGEARDRMIRFLRRRMDEWDISISELRRYIEDGTTKFTGTEMDPIFDDNVTHYQDVFGNSWDGHGEQPKWIQDAVKLGVSLDHFRVEH
jgi:DNA-binding protein H-NS